MFKTFATKVARRYTELAKVKAYAEMLRNRK